jgi:hypothetical protein
MDPFEKKNLALIDIANAASHALVQQQCRDVSAGSTQRTRARYHAGTIERFRQQIWAKP